MRKPSRRHQQYVRKMLNKKECGHWHVTGEVNRHGAVIKHNASGKTLMYSTGDVGADIHAARNFAAQAGAICGCDLAPKRQTRPSRNIQRKPRLDTRMSDIEIARCDERAELDAEHSRLAAEWRDAQQSEFNRNDRRDLLDLIRKGRDIEDQLSRMWATPTAGLVFTSARNEEVGA